MHQGWVKLEATSGSRQDWDFGVVIWSKTRVGSAGKKKDVENLNVYSYARALK